MADVRVMLHQETKLGNMTFYSDGTYVEQSPAKPPIINEWGFIEHGNRLLFAVRHHSSTIANRSAKWNLINDEDDPQTQAINEYLLNSIAGDILLNIDVSMLRRHESDLNEWDKEKLNTKEENL